MKAEGLAATWLNHLAVEKGASANTLSNYRRDVRRYLGWLADNGVDDLAAVDRGMVENYLKVFARLDGRVVGKQGSHRRPWPAQVRRG